MSAALDPVTLEICWNRLIGVVNEQAAALQRTSFTSIVREAGDLSAGIFDSRGSMVAQAVTGTPGHINSMALAMKHVLAAYPLERLAPFDRRIVFVHLTAAGRRVMERGRAARVRDMADRFRDVSDREFAQLEHGVRILQQLLD